jgi:hypothetical protein
METEWMVSAELIQQWRWRCLKDGTLIAGCDLCVAIPGSIRLVPLGERRVEAVQRHDLRHDCGGCVLPIAPLEVKW